MIEIDETSGYEHVTVLGSQLEALGHGSFDGRLV